MSTAAKRLPKLRGKGDGAEIGSAARIGWQCAEDVYCCRRNAERYPVMYCVQRDSAYYPFYYYSGGTNKHEKHGF